MLRVGGRLVRDDRVTTHAALVARAFGASRIYMDWAGEDLEGTLGSVAGSWGGNFELVRISSWRSTLRERRAAGLAPVHLTMYGAPVAEAVGEISGERGVLVVVGAGKVPRELYEESKYNVAVTSQPHSEVAALAVFLDRLQGGGQFGLEFPGARRRIVPSARGKRVDALDP